LLGIWESIRRKPDVGLPLLVLILICSVGLVLYMNFADGTRINPLTGEDYLEVRDRDYFFTPAFIFFGLAIGLGIATVMDMIRETTRNLKPALSKSLFGVTALLVLLPLAPLRANYFINDRSRNFMPFDYSKNYLETCDKDAIIFTNGDNDTFPLWCLQEVYGIRRDVRVVNLSLANTPWYIKQLRDKSHVPLNLSDDAIDRLRPYYINDTDIARIQDQIVEHVLEANNWRYPVYMTVTVPESSKRLHGQSINDNLMLEGMVYRLTPKKGRNQINYEKTRRLFLQEYSYRGVSDPTVYKDENARRLIGNYAQGYLVIADSIRRAGDMPGAFDMVRQGMKVMPWSFDLYAYGAQLLAQMGRTDTMRAFVENAPTDEKWKLYFNWGISAKIAGRADDAIKTLELTHKIYPDYVDAYRALVTMYYEHRYFSDLRKLVTDWVSRHPEDSESRQLLREIQNVNRSADTAEGIR
jgi:tetratricopeptide (TPR) repeat protein